MTAETDDAMQALKKLRVLIRAAARHSSWVEKQCGVSGAQLWIMQELHETPGLRVGEVARRLSVHQTTTSNLVESLVKKGLITRERCEEDLRAVQLQLTDEGKSLIARAPGPNRGLLPEALRKLDAQHLQDLNRGLDGLLEVIGTESGAMEPMHFML